MSNGSSRFVYYPIVLALVLASGIYIGTTLNYGSGAASKGEDSTSLFGLPFSHSSRSNKINDILDYVENDYVDSIDRINLEDEAIQHMLQELDPHSYHITATELAALSEPLEGKFEGIGVQFLIQEDTVVVITPTAGGPSEKVGVKSGDRIVGVNGENIAGNGVTNKKVMTLLRGKRGTEVEISVMRQGIDKDLDFVIVRDQIPIFSMDIAYPVTNDIGYIKLSRFARTTYDEFNDAVDQLEGMKGLVLDLRGNGGGFLDAATDIADEFLAEDQLIVYTEGRARKRQAYYAGNRGKLKNTPVVVLIDDGSASASEILAGALQDNDRGTIMGRRSFGKGLVQEQSNWPDGSATRLTIARYFTPTGRCIQKPYGVDNAQKLEALFDKISVNASLADLDSIGFPDSLIFNTPEGKMVFGGGGIIPDVHIPIDTQGYSTYFSELNYRGLIAQFAFDHIDRKRGLYKKWANAAQFRKNYAVSNALMEEFIAYAESRGTTKDARGISVSKALISSRLKAFMGRNLYNNVGFYPILHERDAMVLRAVELLDAKKLATTREDAKK